MLKRKCEMVREAPFIFIFLILLFINNNGYALLKEWNGGGWNLWLVSGTDTTAAGSTVRIRLTSTTTPTALTIWNEAKGSTVSEKMNSIRIFRKTTTDAWSELARDLLIFSSRKCYINFALPADHLPGDVYYLATGGERNVAPSTYTSLTWTVVDNFEDGTLTDWTVTAGVTNSDLGSPPEGLRNMQLADTATDADEYAFKAITSSSNMLIRFYARSSATEGFTVAGMYKVGINLRGTWFADIDTTIPGFTTDTWYDIKVDADEVNYLYDYYANDVVIVENQAYGNAASSANVWPWTGRAGASPTMTAYVDYIRYASYDITSTHSLGTRTAGDGLWQTAVNWDPLGVPTSSDDVSISGASFNYQPTVASGGNCATLTIASGNTLYITGGTLNITGNLTVNGTLSHTGGVVKFAGSSAQTISSGSNSLTFTTLEIANSSTVDAVDVGTTVLTINNELILTSGKLSLGTLTHTLNGNLTQSSGNFASTAHTLLLNSAIDQTFSLSNLTVNNLTIDKPSATTVTISGNLTVSGNFLFPATNLGTVKLGSGIHQLTNDTTDTFNINGGTLMIDTSTVTISTVLNVGTDGTLNMTGPGTLKLSSVGANIKGKFIALAQAGKPKITTAGVEGTDRYSFVINGVDANNKAEVDIFGLEFCSVDASGLKIGDSSGTYVTITRIDEVEFQNGIEGSSGTIYLNLWLTEGTYVFKLNSFDRYCKNNVGLMNGQAGSSTATIKMENAHGAKGDNDASDGWTGESEDLDPDSDTHIIWKYFKRWVGTVNTLWSLATNWEAANAPADCTAAAYDDVLIASAPYNPMLDVDACVNEIQISSGGKLSLSTKTLTVTGSTYRADDGTFEPNTGTVRFTGTQIQEVNNALNPFYNLVIDKSAGRVNLGANLTVNNNVTLTQGTINLNGKTMNVSGSFSTDDTNITHIDLPTTSSLTVSSLTLNSPSSLTLAGTSSLTTSGSSTLSGTTTLSDSATFTNNSTLSISGTFNLQGSSTLTANGAVTVTGTFNAGGTGPTISGSGSFTVTPAGSVNISKLNFSNTHSDGLTINDGNKIANLNNVSFSATRGDGQRHLYVNGQAAAVNKTFEGCYFAAISGTGKNIVTENGSGTIVMAGYSGPGAGSDWTSATGIAVTWVSSKVWNGNYRYKRSFTVTNNNATAVLPAGAPVELTFDHAALVTAGKSQADGDDIRIVYWNGTAGKELDRVIINKNHNTGWNTANTTIAFPTYADIPAGGSDSNYYIYYGYPDATSPPASAAAAGVIFFDGFESGNLLTGGWIPTGDMIGVFTIDTSSGTYSGGERITASYSDPQWITKSLSMSSFSNIYIYYYRTVVFTDGPPADAEYFRSQYSIDNEATWTTLEEILDVNSALTLMAYSIPNTTTNVRFWSQQGPEGAVGDGFRVDDVRIYANHNGTLPSTTAWAATTEVDITGSDVVGSPSPFSEAFNWSPVGPPTSAHAVIINGGYRFSPNVDTNFTNTILSLSVKDTIDASRYMRLANNLNVSRNVSISSTGRLDASSYTINLGGNFSNLGTFNAGGGTVNFNGGITQSITGSTTFNNLQTQIANTKVTIDSNTTISGTTTIAASTEIEVSSNQILKITGSTVTVDGILDIEPGATLDLSDATSLTVNAGGTFEAIGTAANRAVITSSDTGQASGYSFTIAGTGTINAQYFNFYYPGPCGMQFTGSGAITNLSYGQFDYPSTTSCDTTNSFLIDFNSYTYSTAQSLSNNDFKLTGSGIARSCRGGATAAQHGVITFTAAMGSYTETDPNNLIEWPLIVTPDMTEALAQDTSGGGAGIQYGDTVKLTFNEATNGVAISATNIDTILALSNAHTWGTIVSAVWSTSPAGKTNDTLTITLGSGATVAVDDSITIGGTCPNTICDVTNTNVAVGSLPNITGSFGYDQPDMISAEASDASGGGAGIQAGDKVVIKFSTATNCYPNIGAGNINTILSLNNGHSWLDGSGAILSTAWSTTTYNCDTFTVTLSTTGGAPTVAIGDSITIGGTCPDTICDNQNYNVALGSPPNITGTFGEEATSIISAVASDASGGGPGIQAGDKVTLTFSTSTNGFAITSSNINTILPVSGKTWLDGAGNIQSAVWTDANKTLTITLSATTSPPTIAVGDNIGISGTCPDTICNASNTQIAGGFPIALTGTFGQEITPLWSATPAAPNNTGFQGGIILRSVAGANRVYVGNADGLLYAYDAATGANLSTYNALSAITSPINIVNDIAYFVTANRTLHAVQSNMTDLWSPQDLTTAGVCDATYNQTTSAPLLWSIGGATRIIVGCGQGLFVRNQSDGAPYTGWATNPVNLAGVLSSTVGISSGGVDGYIYAATEAGAVNKCQANDGACPASYSITGSFKSSPFIRFGNIYIGGAGTNTTFYKIDTSTMTATNTYTPAGAGAFESSPYYKLGGRIYVGNNDGKLYCFNYTDLSVCTGSWPYYAGAPIKTLPIADSSTNIVYFAAGDKIYSIDAITGVHRRTYDMYPPDDTTFEIRTGITRHKSMGIICAATYNSTAGTSTIRCFNMNDF